jgi:hypothetical protein
MEELYNQTIRAGDAVQVCNWMEKQACRQFINVLKSHQTPSGGRGKQSTLTGLHVVAEFVKDEQGSTIDEALDKIIGYYKAAGFNPNDILDMGYSRRCRKAFTPLLLAIEHRKLALVKALLKAGADVNQTDKLGYSPLHWAAISSSKVDIIKVLIEAGADIMRHRDNNAVPVLHIGKGLKTIRSIVHAL